MEDLEGATEGVGLDDWPGSFIRFFRVVTRFGCMTGGISPAGDELARGRLPKEYAFIGYARGEGTLTYEVLLLSHGEVEDDPRMDRVDRALKPWRLLNARAVAREG